MSLTGYSLIEFEGKGVACVSLAVGDQVVVLERKKNWMKVLKADGSSGNVPSKAIKLDAVGERKKKSKNSVKKGEAFPPVSRGAKKEKKTSSERGMKLNKKSAAAPRLVRMESSVDDMRFKAPAPHDVKPMRRSTSMQDSMSRIVEKPSVRRGSRTLKSFKKGVLNGIRKKSKDVEEMELQEGELLFHVKVLTDHLGKETELSLVAGEIISVLQSPQNSITSLYGRVQERRGTFPCRIVRIERRFCNPYHRLFVALLEKPALFYRLLVHAPAAATGSFTVALLHNESFYDSVATLAGQEIASTHQRGELFRGVSPTTQLVSSYMRMSLEEYLLVTCGPTLYEIDKKPAKYDFTGDGEAPIEALSDEIDRLLGRLITHFNEVPIGLRRLLNVVREALSGVTGDDKTMTENNVVLRHLVIGGFFFLRCINPAIAQGNVLKPSNSTSRKVFLSLSKVLQQLSNNVSANEGFTGPFVPVLQRHSASVNSFLDQLSVDASTNVAHHIPTNTYVNALGNVHRCTVDFLSTLEFDELEEHQELQDLLLELGAPLEEFIEVSLEDQPVPDIEVPLRINAIMADAFVSNVLMKR